MEQRKKVYLKPGKEQSIMRHHPWIFSGALKKMVHEPEEGELIEVFSHENKFLAIGHYQPNSIAIRILSFQPFDDIQLFLRQRIEASIGFRSTLGLIGSAETNVFRLVHGEADGLPALIIDIYDRIAVVQAHSAGMHHYRQLLADILMGQPKLNLKGVFYKSEQTLPFKADLADKMEILAGMVEMTEVSENLLRFIVDPAIGQKTGFFIDQRDNRALLRAMSNDKKVLNTFCYTGGFSVYALAGGAKEVVSIDSSASAMRLTEQNIKANFGSEAPHRAITGDVFTFLKETQETFDLIVLDPPAFAKHQKNIQNALIGYKRLNENAIRRLNPGGVLFTFSCSQAVDRLQFRQSVFVAAANTGREARIAWQLTQPADHPVSIYHPEGEYLKGLVLAFD